MRNAEATLTMYFKETKRLRKMPEILLTRALTFQHLPPTPHKRNCIGKGTRNPESETINLKRDKCETMQNPLA